MLPRKYGRYEALELIASGGMGSVYFGRARGAGGFERQVAIKVMHQHIAEDPSARAMFLDEARLAACIHHPNVVPTVDVAEDGSFIVMEYVAGASLDAVLKRLGEEGKLLPVEVSLRIILDVLEGLHAAHELTSPDGPLNIVHRDVSPHNILVGVDGLSRLTDFGIAYAEYRIASTKAGELKGKLRYMAPERIEDDATDRVCDVYSVACVLWEMLVGERLVEGEIGAIVACNIVAGPRATPRELRPAVPPAIDAVCMKGLQRSDNRYPSALALGQALEDAARADGVTIARRRDIAGYVGDGQPSSTRTLDELPAPPVAGTAPAAPAPEEHDALAPIEQAPVNRAALRTGIIALAAAVVGAVVMWLTMR